MSFILNEPPSLIAKETKQKELLDGDEPVKKSREDYKKQKELEEARKAGTVPAMQDEFGKDINPHIPQYIMNAPWYIHSKVPTLSHQRIHDEKKKIFAKLDTWQAKGLKEGPVATKFRKGACENCGAMTHKKKDCLERPRKVLAKFSGEAIAPDEHIPQHPNFDYEGKRDMWKSYDTETYNEEKQEEHDQMEEAKRQLKASKLDQMIESGEKEEIKAHDSDDEDELKYADDVDMPGQKFETKQRITVRNLRIREDTAKYLLNLDVNSAHYDAKTRAMRGNPLEGTSKDPSTSYQGENFARATGDANSMAKQQLFAWEAYEKGADVHLQADPTKLELLKREYSQRKETQEGSKKNAVLDKYGGAEHLQAPPKELLLAQSEHYVEYSRTGAVIKGQEKAIAKSRYEEDVYFNNHTAVWGSYWHAGRWGYQCCYSTIKESYCTGEKGREAAAQEQSSVSQMLGAKAAGLEKDDEPRKSMLEEHQEKMERKKNKKKKRSKKSKKKRKRESSSSSSGSSSDSSSEDEEVKKEKRIQEYMKKQDAEEKRNFTLLSMDERKRPFNSMIEVSEPNEEEMEAYRRRMKLSEDPMSKFLP
ncbi:pre-mRNA-splicing factor SLU7-like [Watersipora subatra]|uniref:pre-mRNA-splicing factor SLU7-like n=1 Tax=Watersipora subatra TaxID=2589382 RepID=UPI00355C4BBC